MISGIKNKPLGFDSHALPPPILNISNTYLVVNLIETTKELPKNRKCGLKPPLFFCNYLISQGGKKGRNTPS